MSDSSTISWTDATWGPTIGCTKVSAGCTNCYAIKEAYRKQFHPHPSVKGAFAGTVKKLPDGSFNWTGKVNVVEDRLLQPLGWSRPRRIFVDSMSDLFHDAISDEQITRIFAVMALSRQHTFQVLTKRPERMRAWFATTWQLPARDTTGRLAGGMLTEERSDRVFYAMQEIVLKLDDKQAEQHFDAAGNYIWPGWPLPNVMIGTSTEDQATADQRIPALLDTPAAAHFLSCEPLLGPIDLSSYMPFPIHRGDMRIGSGCPGILRGDRWVCDQPDHFYRGGIDWVIAGGESGQGARPCHPYWVRSLRDQCVAAGVAYHFKQWGDWLPGQGVETPCPDADGRQGQPCSEGRPMFVDQHTHLHVDYQNGERDIRPPERPTLRYDHWWQPWNTAETGDARLAQLATRVGKKRAGRLLDGQTWDQFPSHMEATAR